MYILGKGGGCFAAGRAGRDAEMRTVGDKQTALLKFSVAVGKEADGETKWLQCEAWGETAERFEVCGIKKGDLVTVWGNMRTNEYNGKSYTSLNLDGMLTFAAPERKEKSLDGGFYAMEDEVNDEDLPF